jgi:hypothetical protein
VTDEISKKCLAAFSGLSNCMKRWQVFLYIFQDDKKMSVAMQVPMHKSNSVAFCLFYAGTTLAGSCFWWLLSLAISMASSDQKAQA